MVVTSTSIKVANRISKIYQVTATSVKDTPVPNMILAYLKISEPSRTDLNALRVSLNVYKDSLSTHKVRVYDAVNKILQVVENEFIFEQVGSTVLSDNLNTEHTNGLTFAKIKESILFAISGNTIIDNYAFTIASTIGGVKAIDTSNLSITLITAMNAAIANDDIETAVTALTTALTAAEDTAAGIASAIYDGIYILDSDPEAATGKNALIADITSYSNSDVFVTTTSAIGSGDISSVRNSGDNSLTGVIGNSDISAIGSSLSSAIGTPTTGLLGNSDTTITAAIGETVLTAVTPLGASVATTLSGAVDLLSSKVGLSALIAVGLRGATSTAPSTIKAAIDNIDSAIGDGQLLENAASSGTISGVIGTISTGLLGVESTSIASAIGNVDISAIGSSLSGALVNAIGNISVDSFDTATLSGAIGAGRLLAGTPSITAAIGTSSISNVGSNIASAIGNVDISSIGSSLSSAIGTPTIGLLGNSDTTITAAIGEIVLTGVTPLGASAATTLSGAVDLLSSKVGLSALIAVGLRGATSTAPSTIKAAIDNIDSAIGDDQLLENAASSGTISGVIGTISIGLLGVESTSIASAIGNVDISAIGSSLSSAIGTPATGLLGNSDTTITAAIGEIVLTGVTPLGASAATTLSGAVDLLSSKIGNTQIAPTNALTVHQCSYDGESYTLGDAIYTTVNTVANTFTGMFSCAKWVDMGGDLYFSHTGLVGDCSALLDPGQALAKCLHYLDVTP